MQIQVLRKLRYQGITVYVMQFEYCFQYLIPYGADIYQNHIFIRPPIWVRILYRLGLIKNLYSQEQIEEGEKIILSGAIKTIDELNDPKARAERKAINKAAKRQKEINACLWQAREGKDGMYYVCLTHKQIVRMEDGVQPRHN